MNVLMVDDAETFRLLAAQYIAIEWPDAEVEEWDPNERGEIPESLDLASFDAILLDYMLGAAGDGLQWLRRLRQFPNCPPIIMVTGAGKEEIAVKAMRGGAFDYLTKNDFSRSRLVGALRAAAAERRIHTPASYVARAPSPDDFRTGPLDGERTLPLGTGREPDSLRTQRLGGARASANTTAIGKGAAQSPADTVAINGFRNLRKIGVGGMATVFLGERRADGLEMVLKVMDAKLSEDDEFLARFIQEHGLIAKIAHPNVVRIYDQGFTDDHVYIAMEYFSGGDLRAKIKNGIAPDKALDILIQVAEALKAVHAGGIVHRDLKPDNMMFRADGSLAVVDFGIAKAKSARIELTARGDVLGTPHYLSPEQACGETLDGRSDLYSCGVIFYEMLTGMRPFQGDEAIALALKHVNEPMPRLSAALGRFQDLLDRMTAKRPADRFAGAADVLGYISAHQAALGAVGEPAPELPLIDETRLNAFAEDIRAIPGAFPRMVASFSGSAKQQVADISGAMAAGNAKLLVLNAHSLKSGAATFGAARLRSLAEEIERQARSGQIEGLAPRIAAIEACSVVTLAELARRAGVA